jgi:hypothetical protein
MLPGDTIACLGDTLRLNPGKFDSYLWSDSSTNQIFDAIKEGKYGVVILDSNHCSSLNEIYVNFSHKPIASFEFIEESGLIIFNNTSEHANSYVWYFGDSTEISTEINPTYQYNVNGIYTVTLVSDNEECATSIFNDEINIIGLDVKSNIHYELKVYPNPVMGKLQISLTKNILIDEKGIQIEILNMNGQLVKEETMYESYSSIDMSDLVSGIYIVRIIGKEFTQDFKVKKE